MVLSKSIQQNFDTSSCDLYIYHKFTEHIGNYVVRLDLFIMKRTQLFNCSVEMCRFTKC